MVEDETKSAPSPNDDVLLHFSETCVICLNDKIEEPCMLLPCYHSFCWTCIHAWLRQQSFCPLCKTRPTHLIHNIQSSDRYEKILLSHGTEDDTSRSQTASNTDQRREIDAEDEEGSLDDDEDMYDDDDSYEYNDSSDEYDYALAESYDDNTKIKDHDDTGNASSNSGGANRSYMDHRRQVYRQKLQCVVDVDRVHKLMKTQRFSVSYYKRMEPVIGPKIRDWINRELCVINDDSMLPGINDTLCNLVVSLLSRIDIVTQSESFLAQLQSYFVNESDAQIFVRELSLFVQSDLSIKQYDHACQYKNPLERQN